VVFEKGLHGIQGLKHCVLDLLILALSVLLLSYPVASPGGPGPDGLAIGLAFAGLYL
jgi:hypothetical protein